MTQRNYGIKDIYHFVRKRYAYGKDETENFDKYIYLMQNSKKKIDMLTRSIIGNLIAAQVIHPITIDELNERRKFLDFAIVNCNQLISEFQDVVTHFEIDVNIFGPLQKDIDREIDLIKKWRQRDNKLKSHFTG